jgi:hypothetical protein
MMTAFAILLLVGLILVSGYLLFMGASLILDWARQRT